MVQGVTSLTVLCLLSFFTVIRDLHNVSLSFQLHRSLRPRLVLLMKFQTIAAIIPVIVGTFPILSSS